MPAGVRHFITVSVILVEILASIWLFPYLPMTDLPEHMLAAQVLTHYDAPETPYANFFVRRFPWNPYSSYFLFAWALNPLLSVANATRLYLSLTMVLTVFALWYWIRTQAPGREAQVVPATLLLLGYFFYLGLINFLFSAPFLFLAVALNWRLLDAKRFRWGTAGVLAICLSVAYLSHIVTFALCGLTIFVQCVAFRRRKLHWTIPAFVPSLILFMAFAMTEGKRAVSGMTLSWDPLKTRAATLLLPFNVFYDPLPNRWIYDQSLLALLIAAVVIIALGWLRRDRSPEKLPAGPVAWTTLVLFVCGTVLLPSNVAGGLGIALRLAYFSGFFLVVICPANWDRSAVLRWAMIALCVLAPVSFALRLGPFARDMENLEQAVRSIPVGQVIQPIITEPHSGSIRSYPFQHAAAWYSFYRGGTSPYLFATWAEHFPIHVRAQVLPHVPGEWSMERFDFRSDGSGTDYFLVRTQKESILAGLRQSVPLHTKAGDWLVFGPTPH